MEGFLKQSTAVNITVLMIDSTDHVTGKTGLSAGLTIYATKAAGTPAAITPTVTELDSTNVKGLYKLALTTAHTDTLGEFQLHITATGADPTDIKWQVSSYLPGEAATLQADQAVNVTKVNGTSQTARDLGAQLDATVSSRLASASYTAPDNASITTILSDTNDIQTRLPAALVGGRMDASVGAMAADVMTAAATAADYVTELQSGLATSVDLATVDTVVDAIKVKTDYLPSATAGSAGGVFIAGTNAATTITTAFTTTFTGDLTGSVASVSGAVGSVTGNVGGNVVGSVGSVTGSVGSVTGAVGSVTGAVGSVTGNVGGNVVGSVGSVTGLTASNLDVAVSTRLAGTSYTAPLDAAGTRTAIGLASANLDTQIATLSTSAVTTAIKAKTDSLAFTVTGQVDANIQSINDTAITGNGSTQPFNV